MRAASFFQNNFGITRKAAGALCKIRLYCIYVMRDFIISLASRRYRLLSFQAKFGRDHHHFSAVCAPVSPLAETIGAISIQHTAKIGLDWKTFPRQSLFNADIVFLVKIWFLDKMTMNFKSPSAVDFESYVYNFL